jgi:hypothetical protein
VGWVLCRFEKVTAVAFRGAEVFLRVLLCDRNAMGIFSGVESSLRDGAAYGTRRNERTGNRTANSAKLIWFECS